jgi:acetoin utilization deacetylase AcuC-like enzyme
MRAAVTDSWLPALRAFRPQLLVVSAGFDAHREDDMSHLGWVDADYGWITRQLAEVADACCDGRMVSVLEGGYCLPALARSVEQHVRAMIDLD